MGHIRENGKPVTKKMMSLTMSADSRIVAPDCAAACLTSIRDKLQEADRILQPQENHLSSQTGRAKISATDIL
jgi:hypothetical protein